MQTIGALLGSKDNDNPVAVPELPTTDKFGIELELEGADRFVNVNGWQLHQDGSLRNGVEYVFDGPQGGATALASIKAMQKNLEAHKPKPTFRCSTHIHVDVRDFNVESLRKMVLAYCIFEDVMFDHCDPYRRYSNFCTPYFNNDGFIGNLQKSLFKEASDGHILGTLRAFPKYSALNLQPVQHFGSVEFRGSHALVTGSEILSLANRMLHIKRVAKESKDEPILEFINRLNKMRPQEVFLTGLKDGYVRDANVADTCYSNALMSITKRNDAHEDMARRAMGMAGAEPMQWDAPQAVPNLDNMVVTWREEVFQQYGVMAPVAQNMREAIRVVKAFRNIVGIRPPSLQMLIVENVTRLVEDHGDHLRESFRRANLTYNVANLGMN